MLLGEDSGPAGLSAVHSPFWRSSVEPTEPGLTHTVHNNNNNGVLSIMWTRDRLAALEKCFLRSSGRRICPCACCQRLRQHIFDHHSNIFFADVALDKLCMTSSEILTEPQSASRPPAAGTLSLLRKFERLFPPNVRPATHSDMEQMTLS